MSRCLYCYKKLERSGDYHKECSIKIFGTASPPVLPFSLSNMKVLAKEVLVEHIAIPGVQPKLSLSIGDIAPNRVTVVNALEGGYILKPPSSDFKEVPENEHITMCMAEASGIAVVPSSLIKLNSGELAYITKRIDRDDNGQKTHMLDMYQITEASDKYLGSVERIGKALMSYSANPLLDIALLFERIIFCYLSGNSDMHLKNFSMINTEDGWILSPAYDLLNVAAVLPEDKDESALTINGKRRNLTRKDFGKLGTTLQLNLKQIKNTFERMEELKTKADELIATSFLTVESRDKYISVIIKRHEWLYS